MAHEDTALLFASGDVVNFRAAMKCMIGDSAPGVPRPTIRSAGVTLPGMPMRAEWRARMWPSRIGWGTP